MSQNHDTLRRDLDGLQKMAIAIGVIGCLGAGYAWTQDQKEFREAYLHSFFFWLAPTLGSLSLYMIHQLTGGRWGASMRRMLEAGMRQIPFLALLFIPVLLQLEQYYPWADHGHGHDVILAHKEGWLNKPFFIIRTAIYFVTWFLLAGVMLRVSARKDEGDLAAAGQARLTAGPGVLLFALTMTFAAFDWAMSLEPHWFSTIYGAIFMVGQALLTMAGCIIMGNWLRKREPFAQVFKENIFHDMGTLMFAMVMLWAYTNFSQYLIIWSGNLNEETPWVHLRTSTEWQKIALALVALHFFVPFFLLLFRKNKKHASILAGIALLMFVMRWVDIYWYIGPAFGGHGEHADHGPHLHWIDFVMPVAMGGIWIGLFLQAFKNKPFVTEHDLEMSGSMQHAHH